MQRMSDQVGRWSRWTLLTWMLLALVPSALADRSADTARATPESLWKETISKVTKGDFAGATDAIRALHSGDELTQQVQAWLEEHEAKEAARREIDQADLERFIGYAKARIERKEYWRALDQALAALDCAHDQETFLQSAWLLDLANEAVAIAQEHRKDSEWRKVWQIYGRLSALFEGEPRYRKLEREAITHLRLEAMFKEGSHWEETIERVRWSDATNALTYIGKYYVEPADFKSITEAGLEQLLLLADSKTAREALANLADEDDRNDFKARIRTRLKQVQEAASLDKTDCVRHFRRVVRNINAETVRLPEELLVSELMRGALSPLDDYTNIYWPRASREFDKQTRGNFVGVGISIISNREGEVEVRSPMEDSPAYRAGIQAGDIITKSESDGKVTELKGLSINKVVDVITGPKGTPVTLTIRRNDEEIEFPLVRARVKIRSVKGIRRDPLDEERWDHWLDREHSIGYVRVTAFQKNTVEDVANVLSELSAEGLKGLVLDLRGNPGGLLDSAWEMSSLFLKRGDGVVSTKGRIKSEDQNFETLTTGPFSDVPLIVLVDDRSASASEIVSGAVRDNRRGLVVGERTFGKFSVQNLIGLGRSGAKLKLTTAKYYLPNGDSLHRSPGARTWGVTPDIPVRLVRWEKTNVRLKQRDAELLGPPKPIVKKSDDKTDEKDATADKTAEAGGDKEKAPKDDKAKDTETAPTVDKDTEVVATAEEPEEDKLPPLLQPDENNRPKVDPQLDTALLLMRVTVVGQSKPKFVIAEPKKETQPARP